MKYEELQGFTQPTAELQLESSLENRVAVLDVFTDAMLASQGKPQIVAGFSDTLQVAVWVCLISATCQSSTLLPVASGLFCHSNTCAVHT